MRESVSSRWQNRGCLLVALFVTCGTACGSPSAPQGPDPSPPRPTQPDRPDARSRLLAQLSELPRPEPVLGALDARQRGEFDRILAALSTEEVAHLSAEDSPLAGVRPLLHLAAGGQSSDALFVLATSTRASEELLGASESVDFGRVLAATNQVVRRAALLWLARARETLEAKNVDAQFCEAVDRVAATLQLNRVRHASRELWLRIEPSAAARLNVAQTLLWLGDYDAAEALYRKAKAESARDPDVSAFVTRLAQRLERARSLEKPAADLEGRLVQARTLLELGNAAAAQALLDGDRAEAPKHLGLATTLLIAEFPGLPCPGVTAGLGHPALCAFVEQRDLFGSHAFADLERAFETGGGRSTKSLEDYLGLALVLPWKAANAAQGSADVATRAGALAKTAARLSKQGSDFEAIAVFARALEASARSVDGARSGQAPSIAKPVVDELLQRALALGQKEQHTERTRAAVLAVAAVLSQQLDIRELLDRASGSDPMLSLTQASLGVWASATWGDQKRYAVAQGRALSVMTQLAPQSITGSALVLLLAESQFALDATEANLRALEAVSRKLATPTLPSELSLRAVLDYSACLQKLGDRTQAARALEGVLTGLPARELARAPGLVALARARLALVAPEQTRPAERRRAFEAAFETEKLSSSLLGWRDAWRAKLAQKPPSPAKKAEIERRLGPVQARLAARDLLTLGALELSFDYYPKLGIVPLVRVDPQLLFVPFP